MANDLNQCQFIGRLGADPEVRSAGSSKVANMRIAVGESWKDKNTGERKEKTEWVSITAWGDGLVGVIESYIKKGSRIYVSGKMQTREYEKDGIKRYATEVVLQGMDSKLIMLDGKSDGAKSSGGSTGSSSQRPSPRQVPPSSGGFGDDDGDLPF